MKPLVVLTKFYTVADWLGILVKQLLSKTGIAIVLAKLYKLSAVTSEPRLSELPQEM